MFEHSTEAAPAPPRLFGQIRLLSAQKPAALTECALSAPQTNPRSLSQWKRCHRAAELNLAGFFLVTCWLWHFLGSLSDWWRAVPASVASKLFLFSALCELHNMYRLCVIVAMCCALCPRCSAAPKTWEEAPRSQAESTEEQNDTLQEEMDGHESILSKVGGKRLIFSCLLDISFVRKNSNVFEWAGKHIRPLLFVAAGWLWQSESPLGRLWLSV